MVVSPWIDCLLHNFVVSLPVVPRDTGPPGCHLDRKGEISLFKLSFGGHHCIFNCLLLCRVSCMATYPSGNTVSTENNLANIREKLDGAKNCGASIFTTIGLGRLRRFSVVSTECCFSSLSLLILGSVGSLAENQRLNRLWQGLFLAVLLVISCCGLTLLGFVPHPNLPYLL